MRLLWLSPWLRPLARVQAEALNRRGAEVLLVTSGRHPEVTDQRTYELLVEPRPRTPGSWLELAHAFTAAKRFRPTVVISEIVRDPRWLIFSQLAPTLSIIHDHEPHDSTEDIAWWRKQVERAWILRSRQIVVHSRFVQAALPAPLRSRSTVLPLTSDLAEHEVPGLAPSEQRRDFIVLGRIRPYKNLDIIFQAWDQHVASADYAGDKLIVVGSGTTPTLPQFCVRVDNSYVYNNVVGILSRAKASLVHYRTASQSGVQLLSMQVGTQPIVSTEGGLEEFNPPGETGVEADDVAGLSRRFAVFADARTAARKGYIAKTHYEAHFSVDRSAERWIELLGG